MTTHMRQRLTVSPLFTHHVCDSLPAAFAHHDIRTAAAAPHPRFKHHLIRRRCFPSRQCLPLRYAEHMSVLTSRVSAFEREFERINAVPILIFAQGKPPVVSSG